ncbi:MAG: hypothetical protein QOJ42_8110, partial [Acidobacteriaceae bacterium]|nr:hypothetical protein [Acidobacteriaceae bacterium]
GFHQASTAHSGQSQTVLWARAAASQTNRKSWRCAFLKLPWRSWERAKRDRDGIIPNSADMCPNHIPHSPCFHLLDSRLDVLIQNTIPSRQCRHIERTSNLEGDIDPGPSCLKKKLSSVCMHSKPRTYANNGDFRFGLLSLHLQLLPRAPREGGVHAPPLSSN